jgi:thiol:disulfide interchange protein DsbD
MSYTSTLLAVPSLLLLPMIGCTGQSSIRVPDSAHAVGALDGKNPRLEARLLIDADAARPGEPVRAGVLFDVDGGWHIYWRDPGQAGRPTKLDWDVTGARIGPIEWPAPEEFRDPGGLITYGYENEILLTSPLTFEQDTQGEVMVRVEASFVACRVRCIPGRLELSRPLMVSSEARPADAETRAVFERYARRSPEAPLTP